MMNLCIFAFTEMKQIHPIRILLYDIIKCMRYWLELDERQGEKI